MRAKTRL